MLRNSSVSALLQIISPPRRTLSPEQSIFQQPGETLLIPDIAPAPVCKRSKTGTALKRCRDAWKRAYDEVYAQLIETEDDEYTLKTAEEAGCRAYCSALPVLFDQDGIRNFISCVAHGILIGAIPEEKASRLLYAAQVATAALPRQPKAAKPVKKPRTPTPSPAKNQAGVTSYDAQPERNQHRQ
jgi:hypothetical protein